jgi:hypothetical protein
MSVIYTGGEPYQYVGGSDNTVPLSEAPNAVLKARQFIIDQLNQALGITVDFNEILRWCHCSNYAHHKINFPSAAYMEKQKMAFHSDAEDGLGPIIAGLSLGSSAIMHFRLHAKYENTSSQRKPVMTFKLNHVSNCLWKSLRFLIGNHREIFWSWRDLLSKFIMSVS